MRKISVVVVLVALSVILGAIAHATVFYGDYGRIYGRVHGEKAIIRVEGVLPKGKVPWVEQYRIEPGGQEEFIRRVITTDGAAVFNAYEGDRFQVGYDEDMYLFISPEWAVQKYRKVQLLGVSVSRDKMCPDCGLALQLNDCARGPSVVVQSEAVPVTTVPKQKVVQAPAAPPASVPASPPAVPKPPKRIAGNGKSATGCTDCENEIRTHVKETKIMVKDIHESVGKADPNEPEGEKTLQQKARKNLDLSREIASQQKTDSQKLDRIVDAVAPPIAGEQPQTTEPRAAWPKGIPPKEAVETFPWRWLWGALLIILVVAAIAGIIRYARRR